MKAILKRPRKGLKFSTSEALAKREWSKSVNLPKIYEISKICKLSRRFAQHEGKFSKIAYLKAGYSALKPVEVI